MPERKSATNATMRFPKAIPAVPAAKLLGESKDAEVLRALLAVGVASSRPCASGKAKRAT